MSALQEQSVLSW